MANNYETILQDNLSRLYAGLPPDLDARLAASNEDGVFVFDAFGEKCRLAASGIQLGDGPIAAVPGIIVSLYALHARPEALLLEPLRSFKDFAGSMPYWGAFTSHAEQALVPHVAGLKKKAGHIADVFHGAPATGGDFAFIIYPLPKIALCYIFYEADDEFPATVKCLFSHNADLFLPVAGLADLGEYSSKKILAIAGV